MSEFDTRTIFYPYLQGIHDNIEHRTSFPFCKNYIEYKSEKENKVIYAYKQRFKKNRLSWDSIDVMKAFELKENQGLWQTEHQKKFKEFVLNLLEK